MLEPGSGAGTFIGSAPPAATVVGVELDPITAKISAYLYPSAQIRNEGFEQKMVPENSFTATIGNVPFGGFALHDPAHNRARHRIHNHFILKSLALTAPGGNVAAISSPPAPDDYQPPNCSRSLHSCVRCGGVRWRIGRGLRRGRPVRAACARSRPDVLAWRCALRELECREEERHRADDEYGGDHDGNGEVGSGCRVRVFLCAHCDAGAAWVVDDAERSGSLLDVVVTVVMYDGIVVTATGIPELNSVSRPSVGVATVGVVRRLEHRCRSGNATLL